MSLPYDVDFGPVQQGCASTRFITLVNRCASTTVLISQLSVGGDFANVSASSLSVAPSSTVSVTLRFTPTGVGARVGALEVSGSDGTLRAGLFGQGLGGTTMTERYTVPTQTDLLFVIDDSGSMVDKQDALASNMATFLAPFGSQPWRAAVINHDDTTSSTTAGNFIGTPKVLTNQAGLAALQSRVQLGQNGDGVEKGLTTLWRSVSPPLLTAGNAGFLRGDTTWSVVLLTDAEDQSSGTAQNFVNLLANVRGGRGQNRTTISGLVPLSTSSCSVDTPASGRYQTVIDAFGGRALDICSLSAPDPFAQLGTIASGRRTTWFLQGLPTGPVSATVNGSAVSGATYNSLSRTVVLPTPPNPGDTVAFSYSQSCVP